MFDASQQRSETVRGIIWDEKGGGLRWARHYRRFVNRRQVASYIGTDITYIPVSRGFLYLVAIMDWATRHVLAWRLSNTMDARDFLVFGSVATASLLSGVLLDEYDWQAVNYFALPFLLVAMGAIVWLKTLRRRGRLELELKPKAYPQ
jgi:hypothetical protein